MRRPGRASAFLASLVAGLGLLTFGSSPPGAAERVAVVLEVEGVIGPASADYLDRGLAKARERNAEVVILQLDTPGGLVTSMREMIQDILASPLPVVAYVAPSGAHAASAGTYLVYASHVAAMAPGTNLGAATPVRMGVPGPSRPPTLPEPSKRRSATEEDAEGEGVGDEREEEPLDFGKPLPAVEDKAVSDAAAYIRSLAQLRGRNAEWAEKAVLQAASLSAEDALREGVIDILASHTRDLLAQLDGRSVKVLDSTRRLATEGLAIDRLMPDWRSELLALITDPNVAYVLMLLGIYGIIIELYSPGLVGPGVLGAICLLLALYAFHVLPINYAGAALVGLGLALMVGEAFVPSFGVLGIGGVAAFVIGSVMLLDTDVPGYGVSWLLIGSVALVSAGGLLLVMTLMMRARRRAVVTGPEEMIGSRGRVLAWRGHEGSVRVHGEVWKARSARTLQVGREVRVAQIEGLTLLVEPEAKQGS